MNKATLEVQDAIAADGLAQEIAARWTSHNNDRQGWIAQKQELRNYLFATDTSTTSNSSLPWKNKTTLPKLCQIRDNLHANYLSALFPNDDWVKWEGGDKSSVTKEKRQAIEGYMGNKVRESDFRTTISKLLYDYIDYGNAFYDTTYVNESHTSDDGEVIPGYIGPRLSRISPLDIVFNPVAATFDDTYKITRYVKTMGELKEEVDSDPNLGYNSIIMEQAERLRTSFGSFSTEDMNKLEAFQVDGFGSYTNYLASGYVEVLEFEGSIYDSHEGRFLKNYLVTVIDRMWVVRKEALPTWTGKSTKGHVGWRFRPDNLYSMGPLDNLVGMQYRIDHLENLKADAMDLAVHPPLVITGNVEEFVFAPGAEIYLEENGNIAELGKNLNGVISANNEISILENKMEEMAGAPKQAMGIRTPGEKTAFEVQTLEMAASRIFQNKITNFEIGLVEPALNRMLELARRNLDGSDLIRVMDDDFGAAAFLTITKSDITASGKLRPVGARHFAAQATLMQNLMGLANSALWQDPKVAVHFSGKATAKMVEELLGLEKWSIVSDNVAVAEGAETAQLSSQAAEDVAVTNATPAGLEGPIEEDEADAA